MECVSKSFSPGVHVVYPTHGVGRVESVETQEISGHKLEMIVIRFEKDKLLLRVPTLKADSSGLRKLSTREAMQQVMTTLRGRARVRRVMWSRRSQEYESKINSGDPVSIAEVVRDLYRAEGKSEQSFSERQVYRAAIERLAREFAAVEDIDEESAARKLEETLAA